MKKSNYHFFSVSLVDNISTLIQTINKFDTLYDKFVFTIICPEINLETFQKEFEKYDQVNIISENTIITLSLFEEVVQTIADEYSCSFSPSFRIKWYYQQILKVIFFLQNVGDGSYLVMWDADTLPVANIKFYNKGEACLHGSRLEFHKPYFVTIRKIIPNLPPDFFASTVQFFSANELDADYLLGSFKNFLRPSPNEAFEVWIAKVIMTSICCSYSVLDASLFSEQELFGVACMCRTKRKQSAIMYLRWNLNGILSKRQINIVRLCGFKHITYENFQLIRERRQTWRGLLCVMCKELIRQKIGYRWFGPVKDRWIRA